VAIQVSSAVIYVSLAPAVAPLPPTHNYTVFDVCGRVPKRDFSKLVFLLNLIDGQYVIYILSRIQFLNLALLSPPKKLLML
jgi:hypothetical protein